MDAQINTIAQLGGTVFTVVAFLYYLQKNQQQVIDAQIKLAIALETLTQKIDTNTLINSVNSAKLRENTGAVQDNTAKL